MQQTAVYRCDLSCPQSRTDQSQKRHGTSESSMVRLNHWTCSLFDLRLFHSGRRVNSASRDRRGVDRENWLSAIHDDVSPKNCRGLQSSHTSFVVCSCPTAAITETMVLSEDKALFPEAGAKLLHPSSQQSRHGTRRSTDMASDFGNGLILEILQNDNSLLICTQSS